MKVSTRCTTYGVKIITPASVGWLKPGDVVKCIDNTKCKVVAVYDDGGSNAPKSTNQPEQHRQFRLIELEE